MDDSSSGLESRRGATLRSAELVALAQQLVGESGLLLASNRGPIQYRLDQQGELHAQRGTGGVVTALSSLQNFVPVTWVAAAMSRGDRAAAERAADSALQEGPNLRVRFVQAPADTFHRYYSVFSNPLLWFLQHYMWNPGYGPNIDASTYRAWHEGYVPTNQSFAEVVSGELHTTGAPFALLHDYHLYLVAQGVRERSASGLLQHFVHIPWPDPNYWTFLPKVMRQAIFEGLCANDIVGFQTSRFADGFLLGCEYFLAGAEVDTASHSVRFRGRTTRARVYPISIDVESLHEMVASGTVRRHLERLRPYCGEQTIVRVDRLEPSKNIVRGFRAFDLLLQRHRNLRGLVKMLAFLVPSRSAIKEYESYALEVSWMIDTINRRYGTATWKPIELFLGDNYAQALAGLCLYDVLLVNPVIDGMNLVSKEGPTVNTRDGVLILSEGAGSFEQLQQGAVAVTATDVEGTAEALWEALTMSTEARQERSAQLRGAVEQEDLARWLLRQLQDLAELMGVR